MKVYWVDKMITRDKLQANPDVIYLFGDNDIRKGLGGQAKEMRGEPNAFGISTKKLPNNKPEAFKTDDEFEINREIIIKDTQKVIIAILTGKYKSLVIPILGVGMARLPEKAPKTYELLQEKLKLIEYFAINLYK